MKTIGIVLLCVGLLSLFGGIINPSGAIVEVVIIGYVFKFALVFGGIALISSSNKGKAKDSLLFKNNESIRVEKQNPLIDDNKSDEGSDWDKLVIPTLDNKNTTTEVNLDNTIKSNWNSGDYLESSWKKKSNKEFTLEQAKIIISIYEILFCEEIKFEFNFVDNNISWGILVEVIYQKHIEITSREVGVKWSEIIDTIFEDYGYFLNGYDDPYDFYFIEMDFDLILEEKGRFFKE